MKKSRAIDILNLVDESRYAHWKLAVDANCYKLKPALEKLGFKVISFQSNLSDEDVHKNLIKERVNFFITENGVHFVKLLGESRTCYSLLWLDQRLLADVNLTAKTIEGAIMYDRRLRTPSTYAKITGQYVTDLPQKKKEYLRSQKR